LSSEAHLLYIGSLFLWLNCPVFLLH